VKLTHAPGAAAWSTTAGTLSAPNGVKVTLTAPDTAQQITVTGGTATLKFDIIAPTAVAMDREPGTGVQHDAGRPTSGIQMRVFLGPDTVNFNKVIYHEMDVAGTGNGVYSCNPASGGHCHAGGGGHACGDKTMTDTVVTGKGTQSTLGDCALSGDCCGATAPFTPGTESLSIPYEYKVGSGSFHQFDTAAQTHVLADDKSTLTTSKGGAGGTASGSTTVSAASSAIAQCPIGHCGP
jgi:hypothetical protein